MINVSDVVFVVVLSIISYVAGIASAEYVNGTPIFFEAKK